MLPLVFLQKTEQIALHQQNRIQQFCGKIELDESYFVGVRKGKCGRGASGKMPVFGILKQGGKVYTEMIENTQKEALIPIIRAGIKPASLVYIASYRSYNALDVSELKHYRVRHSERKDRA